jgi:hypothetical protein
MKTLLRFVLIAILFAPYCRAQAGTVTFYSRSITAKSEAELIIPMSKQPFGGLQGEWVLDGEQQLARVRAGRFVTFHLTPGEHTFTDSGLTGDYEMPLVMNVKAGGQYCVRLFATLIYVGFVSLWQNRLVEVPCEQAQREAAHLKPIDIKQVDPAVRAEFEPQKKFPGEIPSQHSP